MYFLHGLLLFFHVRLQVTIMTTRCQALTILVLPDVTRRDLKAVASELWAFFPLKLTPRIFFSWVLPAWSTTLESHRVFLRRRDWQKNFCHDSISTFSEHT